MIAQFPTFKQVNKLSWVLPLSRVMKDIMWGIHTTGHPKGFTHISKTCKEIQAQFGHKELLSQLCLSHIGEASPTPPGLSAVSPNGIFSAVFTLA